MVAGMLAGSLPSVLAALPGMFTIRGDVTTMGACVNAIKPILEKMAYRLSREQDAIRYVSRLPRWLTALRERLQAADTAASGRNGVMTPWNPRPEQNS